MERVIKIAINESWRGTYPPPMLIRVQNSIHELCEMITVLEQGGFDMPEELQPYTAKAKAKIRQNQKINNHLKRY